jgi:IS4 transposase
VRRTTKKERAMAEHLFGLTRAEMKDPTEIAPWAGQKRDTRRTWYALARVLVAKLARLGAS